MHPGRSSRRSKENEKTSRVIRSPAAYKEPHDPFAARQTLCGTTHDRPSRRTRRRGYLPNEKSGHVARLAERTVSGASHPGDRRNSRSLVLLANVVQRPMARAKGLDRAPKPHPLRENAGSAEIRPRLPELGRPVGTVATSKPRRTAARCVGPMQRRHVQLLQTPQRHLLPPRRGSAMALNGATWPKARTLP